MNSYLYESLFDFFLLSRVPVGDELCHLCNETYEGFVPGRGLKGRLAGMLSCSSWTGRDGYLNLACVGVVYFFGSILQILVC